jgi:integrase
MTRSKHSSAILLTDAAVSKLRKGDQRRRIRDLGAQSLFLIIERSGHKAWQMRFRRPGGKIGKITLGPVHTGAENSEEPVIGMPLTLRAARQLAAEVHRQRSLQRDVIADYKAEQHRKRAEIADRGRESFGACAARYVDEHARKRLRGWRGTAKLLGLSYPPECAGPELIKGGLAERWAERTLREIDGHDVWSVMEEAKRIGVPGLGVKIEDHSDSRARHLRNALSALFSWAHRQRLVETNPCRAVAPPSAPASRDRILTNDEIRWFWKACSGMRPFEGALKILLLTGQRRDEVAEMLWDELRDNGEWHLPRERTKNKRAHVVALPQAALSLIQQEPRTGRYVFTTTGKTPISGWSKTKRKLDLAMLDLARLERDKNFEIEPWRIHDLRRTAVTGMARAGADLHVVERAVNHVSGSFGGIVSVYQQHKYSAEVRTALEAWSNLVAGIIEGRNADNVIPMVRKEG